MCWYTIRRYFRKQERSIKMPRRFGSQLIERCTRMHSVPSLLLFFYHANPHHCLLAFSPSLQRRSIEWFRRKLRFYREIAIRAAISSSVSFFKRRVICFPCKGQISGGEDDIILHARRSDVKSHLRASPLPFAHLTFHRVYNGFLSRGIVQVTKEAVVMKANY